MSELKHIYRNAANIIRAKYSAMLGVEKVLDSLESRLPDGPTDPRSLRDLFFEPRMDAQQLSVPFDTAEVVAHQLHKFGLLRLWVRITCPNVDEGEVGTVLETDNPEAFDRLADESCHHCGGHHDFDWEHCETVFALNSYLDESEQHFDYSVLKSQTPQPSVNGKQSKSFDIARCEAVVNGERAQVDQAGEMNVIAVALRANHSLQEVPSAFSAWWHAWVGPFLILFLYLILVIPVARLCGQWIALAVSVVVLVALFLVIRGQVQAKLAPTIVQRTALWGGFSLATYCVAAGSTGFHFKGGAGRNAPWWSRVDFGELSIPLLAGGILLFALTLLFVFAFDLQRGWLSRDQEKH